jgi:flagellar protein FlbD
MISLTRMDGAGIVVNADHILSIEATPDTVLLLTTGLHLMVRETVADVVDRTASWRRRVHVGPELKGVVLPFRAAEED